MSLLNPLPLSAEGGLFVSFFCLMLLMGLLVAAAQEALLWLRAQKVTRASGRLPEALDSIEQLPELTATISGSTPLLAPSASKLADSAFARDGRLYSGADPRDLFRVELLRAKGGGVLLSPAVLEGMPRLLLGLGLTGCVGGMLLAMEGGADLEAGLRLGGRAVLWGLFANVLVQLMHRWSEGASEQAVHRLNHALDSRLARGTDADVLQQLANLQAQSSGSLAQVEQAVVQLASLHAETVDEAKKTRRAIDDLGKGIGDAFMVSVVDKLNPTLLQIQRLSSETTTETRRFVQTASTAQTDGVAKIVEKVMEQLDNAIGNSLRTSAEVLSESADKQRRTMDSYNDSMVGTRALVEDLAKMGEELTAGAERMQQATEPAREAATAFLETARRLEHVLPHVIDASDAYLRSKDALDHASQTLANQTTAYSDAAELVRKMVGELDEAQSQATKRVAQGVDEAVMGPMREAGTMLESFSEAQREGIGSWQKSTRTLNDTVAELQKATANLSSFAGDLEKAYEPSIQAASAFRDASESLKATVPEIEKIGTVHREAAVAIDSAAASAGRSILQAAQTSSQAIDAASRAGAKAIQDATNNSAALMKTAGEESSEVMRTASEQSAKVMQAAGASSTELMREAGTTGSSALSDAAKASAKAVREAAVASSDIIETASRSGTEQLEAAVARSAALIKEAGQQSSEAIASSGKTASDSMRASSRASANTLEEMADRSSKVIDASAQSAAELIRSATQDSTDGMEQAARSAGEAIEKAREAVDGGADGYLKAAQMVRTMVAELQQVHEQAVVRVSAGIDEALGSSLRDAGSHLEGVNDSQRRQLDAWQQLMDTFAPTVEKMGSTASDLDGLVQRYADSARPATEAAEAFGEAARNAASLMPRMDEAVKSYQTINSTLVEAAGGLATSSMRYAEAGQSVAGLVSELQTVMDSNRQGQQALVDTMSRATTFVDSLGPASESVKQAAIELHEASLETAKVVGDIRETVVVQGKAVTHMKATAGDIVEAMKDQNQQFLALMSDMDKLEGTITKGVSLLTEQLPRSVDETVVSFDAALAEGVERLGSAVERLRESMDDLQERLDMVMTRK